MDNEIKNKLVVVTGGAEGLGYAIAEAFLYEDAKTIVILDINKVKGVEAADKLNAKFGDKKAAFIYCDVTKDLDEVSKKIFETYKQVDVLVNSAGVVDEINPRRLLEINLISLVEWTIKFRDHMRKDKGGHGGTIINIGSVYSHTVDPFLVFYKTSKFGVMGFSRSIGHKFNYDVSGVRVIIICPGFTFTTLTAKMLPWEEHNQAIEEFKKDSAWQTAEIVGKASVDIFKKADSGTAWDIVGDKVEEFY